MWACERTLHVGAGDIFIPPPPRSVPQLASLADFQGQLPILKMPHSPSGDTCKASAIDCLRSRNLAFTRPRGAPTPGSSWPMGQARVSGRFWTTAERGGTSGQSSVYQAAFTSTV